MGIGAALLAVASSLVARVLLALGFAVVTIGGMTVAIGAVKGYVIDAVGGLPGDIAGLFFLAGGGVALNFIFGAIAFRLAYWVATRSVRVLGVSG